MEKVVRHYYKPGGFTVADIYFWGYTGRPPRPERTPPMDEPNLLGLYEQISFLTTLAWRYTLLDLVETANPENVCPRSDTGQRHLISFCQQFLLLA